MDDNLLVKPNTALLKWHVDSRLRAKIGDSGAYIEELQRILIAMGYNCGVFAPDGNFGPTTENAVRKFQKDHDLPENGIIDIDTISAML